MGARIYGGKMKRNVHVEHIHLPPSPSETKLGELEKELKPLILSIVERAFKRYADAHVGASDELKEEEWKRLKKILNGML
jgi:hypothetical protein